MFTSPSHPRRILCFFGIFYPGRGSSAPFAFPKWEKIKGKKEAKQLPQVQIGSREELRLRVGTIEFPNKSGGHQYAVILIMTLETDNIPVPVLHSPYLSKSFNVPRP